MAILRSVDGKFFEVPDKDLDKFEIPADQVREKLGDAAMAEPGGPGGGGAGPGGPGGSGGSQVVIQILGGAGGDAGGPGAGPSGADDDEVQPYWGWWRNCWRNHWRNHWQNCWRNCY